MSHGDRVERFPRAFASIAQQPGLTLRGHRACQPAALRRAVSSRGGAHARRRGASRQLRPRHLRLPRPPGPWPATSSRSCPRSGRRSAAARVHVRALRGRRFGGGGGAGAPGHRRPAPVHLRRHRPACGPARPSRSQEVFERDFKLKLKCVDAERALLRRRWRASPTPSASARASATTSSRSSSTRPRRSAAPTSSCRARSIPDVIESVSVHGPSASIKSHHNVGGLARAPELQAARAAARALQGRGPGPRRAAADPGRRVAAAAVPGPGPRHPHPRARSTRQRLALVRDADVIVQEEIAGAEAGATTLAGLRRAACRSSRWA